MPEFKRGDKVVWLTLPSKIYVFERYTDTNNAIAVIREIPCGHDLYVFTHRLRTADGWKPPLSEDEEEYCFQ